VSRVVVSELAGRASVVAKSAELGLAGVDESAGLAVVERIKAREAEGFSFEAAEASVALLALRARPGYRAPFELIDYRVIVAHGAAGGSAEATVKLRIGERTVHTAAEGDGPVHALDAALRKALSPVHPALADLALADYKVRILDGAHGTRAVTRVLIDWDLAAGARRFGTVGASKNIIEATWLALVDGLEFGLTHVLGKEQAA
jgi:2-isopropylmalate synthase